MLCSGTCSCARTSQSTILIHRILSLLRPRLASPRLASPRLASPRLASPRLASPRLASPRLASPRLASPRLASPRLASPRLASPRLASPRLASPRLASPRLASPRPTRSPSHLIAGASLSSVMLSLVVRILASFFRAASILRQLWGYCLHAFSGRVLAISVVGIYFPGQHCCSPSSCGIPR